MPVTLWDPKERSIQLGEYIVEHSATVRSAAAVFGISKSTVHKDVTKILPHVQKDLAEDVSKILSKNKQERHLRGGEATKRKYSKK